MLMMKIGLGKWNELKDNGQLDHHQKSMVIPLTPGLRIPLKKIYLVVFS